MAARLIKRGNIWYAWVPSLGGGTHLVSTNCTDRKAADKRAGQIEREAVDPTHAAANKATTSDACAEFLGSRKRRGRAEGTLHHYRVKLGHVLRLMPKRLDDIDAGACERFIEVRLEEGAAQTTVKKEIRALGATLRHARRSGTYRRVVEMVIPELEETYKPRERFLTPMELVGLCNVLPGERAAHIVFIVATGARWSESVRARRADIEGPMVMLRGTKTKGALRTVPVPPPVRGALAWSLRHAPTDLFLPWGNVRRDLAVACRSLGIAPVTPNDLRRTFGTWLAMTGVTTDLIGKAMGHIDGRMAERVYGRITPAALDRLIAEKGPAMSYEKESKKPVGLMSSDVAETGAFEGTGETAKTTGNLVKTGARGRNRTADTGIFNPPEGTANVGESAISGDDCRPNVLTFGERARRWLMRKAS